MENNSMIRAVLIPCLIFLLAFSCSSLAEPQSETELWNSICAKEQLTLNEALELFEGNSFQMVQLSELCRVCEALSMREGIFVQEGRSSKGKVYTATVEFYFNKGVPYCSIDYTNYAGMVLRKTDTKMIPLLKEYNL